MVAEISVAAFGQSNEKCRIAPVSRGLHRARLREKHIKLRGNDEGTVYLIKARAGRKAQDEVG